MVTGGKLAGQHVDSPREIQGASTGGGQAVGERRQGGWELHSSWMREWGGEPGSTPASQAYTPLGWLHDAPASPPLNSLPLGDLPQSLTSHLCVTGNHRSGNKSL